MRKRKPKSAALWAILADDDWLRDDMGLPRLFWSQEQAMQLLKRGAMYDETWYPVPVMVSSR